MTREFPSYFPLYQKGRAQFKAVIAQPYKTLNRDKNRDRKEENEKNGWRGERERERDRGSNADRLSVPRHRYLPLLLSPLSLPVFPLEEVPTIPSKTPGESRGLV